MVSIYQSSGSDRVCVVHLNIAIRGTHQDRDAVDNFRTLVTAQSRMFCWIIRNTIVLQSSHHFRGLSDRELCVKEHYNSCNAMTPSLPSVFPNQALTYKPLPTPKTHPLYPSHQPSDPPQPRRNTHHHTHHPHSNQLLRPLALLYRNLPRRPLHPPIPMQRLGILPQNILIPSPHVPHVLHLLVEWCAESVRVEVFGRGVQAGHGVANADCCTGS